MRTANLIISVILIAFTGFYAALIMRLPSRNLPHTLGADFVPWVFALGLFLLSILLLLKGIFDKQGSEGKVKVPLKELGGILALLVIIIIYIKAMDYVGFLISSILFLVILTLISGSRKPLGILIFSITTTVAIYFLFYHFFNVQLPSGQIF